MNKTYTFTEEELAELVKNLKRDNSIQIKIDDLAFIDVEESYGSYTLSLSKISKSGKDLCELALKLKDVVTKLMKGK